MGELKPQENCQSLHNLKLGSQRQYLRTVLLALKMSALLGRRLVSALILLNEETKEVDSPLHAPVYQTPMFHMYYVAYSQP